MGDIRYDQDDIATSATGFQPDDPVVVPALTFLREGDDVVIGRHETGSYAVVPADTVDVLHRLVDGSTPREAGDWYAARYDEEIDVLSMLDDLVEIGVLDPPGTAVVPPADSKPVRWQRLGTVAFSPVAMVGYGLVLTAGVLTAWAQPDLRPDYADIFFTDYLTLVAVVLAVGQWPFIFLHEAAHALAGRRLGLATKLTFSHRLQYLVFETSMDGLVTVPRRRRWVPMLAGIGVDLIVMALLTLAAAAMREPDGSLPLAARILLAISFGTMLRILWQFFFYLRTDIYYLLSLVLGTVNLHQAATLLLRRRLRQLWRQPPPGDGEEPDIHPTDRQAARWYVWFMVLGYAITLATLVFAIVPLAVAMISEAIAELDGRAGAVNLIDSAVILALAVGQLGLVVFLAIRNRRQQAAPSRTTPAAVSR
ncbi:hypothetical protein ACN27F_05815 [Solwaraspora sp. WMMB335]|uniref:hypothetical protein n=1 Tax=Solwaraspora sp. WMMB335 TaxID=3404118 RepID=UPI003B92D5E4